MLLVHSATLGLQDSDREELWHMFHDEYKSTMTLTQFEPVMVDLMVRSVLAASRIHVRV